ncbi:transporter substrate-binding domain-containing protein [Bradyrhizobium sp.]|uniref:transporter substrate-binding domain-containing protein n=1 Tax=Bradyrhizobium sp. TaxID=376 RepID=UPI0039E5F09C
MKIRIAYIEEPPFYWTAADGSTTGADIELAEVVLRAIGVSSIEYQKTSFDEFLPGVAGQSWDMNVPIFITPGRAKLATFSVPVWAIGDGFLVQHGNPKALVSYESVASRSDARIALIAGQVQIDTAKSAGVTDSQIVIFKDQPTAVDALLAGKVDAYASTAVGNRVIAGANEKLEAVAHETRKDGRLPLGGFSFNKSNHDLIRAVNEQLRKYIGSPDHRARMAKYGLVEAEIDPVVG